MINNLIKICILLLIVFNTELVAQESALLEDRNGDESLVITAFGDSVTFGVGDAIASGEIVEEVEIPSRSGGYPTRVANSLNIPVRNVGIPGELFIDTGLTRFADILPNTNSDVVFFLEGLNDATFRADAGEYERSLQKLINISRFLNIEPVIGTLPPPCCDRAGRSAFTESYSKKVREVSALNDVSVVDIENLWKTLCPDPEECSLVNRPEGLHPNTIGYDAIGQILSSTLLGLDIFSEEGILSFATAVEIPPEKVITSALFLTEDSEEPAN